MKRNNNVLLLVLGSMLMVSACSTGSSVSEAPFETQESKKEESSAESSGLIVDIDTSTEEAPTEEASTEKSSEAVPDETESSEEETNDDAIGRVDGFTVYEKGQNPFTEAGDVYLSARLAAAAKVTEGYFSLDAFYLSSDNRAVVSYVISDNIQNPFEDDSVYFKCRQYLASYDLKNNRIISQIMIRDSSSDVGTYFAAGDSSIIVWKDQGEESQGEVYDYELNSKGHFKKNNNDIGALSGNGDSLYYLSEGVLYRQSSAQNDSAQKISMSEPFLPTYINSIYTDEDGTDYGFIDGTASDLQAYRAIVNLETGEIAYLVRSASFYIDHDVIVERGPWTEEGVTYKLSYKNTKLFSYKWNTTSDVSLNVLPGGIALFSLMDYNLDGSVMTLELYDVKEGRLLGRTKLNFSNVEKWISFTPVLYEEEKRLIVPISDNSSDINFYSWDYSKGDLQEGAVISAEVPQIIKDQPDYICDPSLLVARECQPDFKALRDLADTIEQQMGVDIYIGNECGGIIGGYAVVPLDDYAITQQALETLQYEMSRYPEGFFKQFDSSYLSGIDIYLAGSLIGTSEYNLSTAGGFQTEYNGGYAIFADVIYPESIRQTFHHELSHAIDMKINSVVSEGNLIFDENYWNSLNPVQNGYTNSYSEFGNAELAPYIYDTYNKENAYYIDSYSQTFPTEDRARLFEYAVADYGWIDWYAAPHLKAKLDYYAQAIRLAFDTTGWNNVIWEK